MGAGFVGSPNMDRVKEEEEHQKKARIGLELARTIIAGGKYATVVLDEFVDTLPEVMTSLPYELLQVSDIQNILKLAEESQTQVIITGRQMTHSWEKFVKESIVISQVKHPYATRGTAAISGLDF